MLIETTEKHLVFSPGQIGDRYFNYCGKDGEIIAYFCLNFIYAPYALVHLHLPKLTISVMREGMKKVWPSVLNVCRDNMCDYLIADAPGNMESTKRFRGFCKHFGFHDFEERVQSIQRIK
jgi:hypothetical protein